MGPVRHPDDEEVAMHFEPNGQSHFKTNGHFNGLKNGFKPKVDSDGKPKILQNVLHQIGHTPMIKLNRIPIQEGVECDIFAKCELFAPGGSHKDRIALRMIEQAEADGRLVPGSTIIEPTSGNTGIGVAMVAAVKGYKCILVMPEKMSQEKHETMAAFGAQVVRTPKNVLHTTVAQQIQKQTPNSIILDQYGNANNPMAHYETTAEEIIEQCDGKLDMIVMGVGTGGVITGIGRKIKEKLPFCTVVGVDPEGSIMALPGKMTPESINETTTNFWEVEGIGHDWLPDVLDRSVVDKWVKCNDNETFNMARRLIKEEGLLVGGSCGSALVGAIKAAKELGLKKGQRVVIVLPDSVRNYMTKFLSDQWMHERGFLPDAPVTQNYSWWSKSAGSILTSNVSTPQIHKDGTVGQALTIMRSQRLDQLPVTDAEGNVQGVVTLNNLLKSLPSTEIKKESPVSNFLFSQYKRVTEKDSLGKVNYMLQAASFVVVIQPIPHVNAEGKNVVLEKLRGVITSLDLTEFAIL